MAAWRVLLLATVAAVAWARNQAALNQGENERISTPLRTVLSPRPDEPPLGSAFIFVPIELTGITEERAMHEVNKLRAALAALVPRGWGVEPDDVALEAIELTPHVAGRTGDTAVLALLELQVEAVQGARAHAENAGQAMQLELQFRIVVPRGVVGRALEAIRDGVHTHAYDRMLASTGVHAQATLVTEPSIAIGSQYSEEESDSRGIRLAPSFCVLLALLAALVLL